MLEPEIGGQKGGPGFSGRGGQELQVAPQSGREGLDYAERLQTGAGQPGREWDRAEWLSCGFPKKDSPLQAGDWQVAGVYCLIP